MLSSSDHDTILACIMTGLALGVYSLISEDIAAIPLVEKKPFSLCCEVRCHLKSIG